MRRYLAVLGLLGVGVLVLVTFAPIASSAIQSIALQPGDNLTVNCSTSLAGQPSGQQATFTCASVDSSRHTPTSVGQATATPTSASGGAQPTPTPSPTPMPVVSTSTPTPTSSAGGSPPSNGDSPRSNGGGSPPSGGGSPPSSGRGSAPSSGGGTHPSQGGAVVPVSIGGGGGATTALAPLATNPEAAAADQTPQTLTSTAMVAEAPPAAAPLLSATVVLNPAESGRISLPGGQVVLMIPAGAFSDVLTVTISAIDASPTLPATTEMFTLGTSLFQVTATDPMGNTLAVFDPLPTVTIQPSSDDLSAVGNDLSRLVLAVDDTDNGVWQLLPTTVNPDGTLSALLDHPAIYALVMQSAPASGATSTDSAAETTDAPPPAEGS